MNAFKHPTLRRRVARRLLPPAWLVAPGVRAVLGLESAGRNPVDRIAGLRIEYSLDSLIGQLLYLHGGFEESEAAYIEQRLRTRPGAVMLDVGANIGLHSLRAARLREVEHVYAFEPGRTTFAILGRNIARNELSARITASPCAVSSGCGEALFHFCADDAYSSLKPDQRRPVQESYAVELETLDHWCDVHRPARVDLVKIDVEGAEPEVIAGASRMLQQFRPELIVEVFQGTRTGFSAPAFIDDICSRGYEPWVLVDGRATAYRGHDDRFFNYHFVPRPD